MWTFIAYFIYLILSLLTVFVVGRSLHAQGKVYLFGECPDHAISDSANNFLYVCYCLVNTGFALFFLNSGDTIHSFKDVLEFVFFTQGIIFTCLGVLHFLNVLFAPKIVQHYLQKKLLTNKNRKS
jgi:hypothetical protein